MFKRMLRALLLGLECVQYNSSESELSQWVNERDVKQRENERSGGWLSWTHYRQLRRGASICLGARQAANLEAVVFPASTLALAGPGAPLQTHPSTRVPRHISAAPASNTYKSPDQYLQRLASNSGVWAGTWQEFVQPTCSVCVFNIFLVFHTFWKLVEDEMLLSI